MGYNNEPVELEEIRWIAGILEQKGQGKSLRQFSLFGRSPDELLECQRARAVADVQRAYNDLAEALIEARGLDADLDFDVGDLQDRAAFNAAVAAVEKKGRL